MAERKRGRKRKRRDWGTGSVYQWTDSGGRTYWRATLELERTPDGKRQRKVITGRDEETVRRRLADAQNRLAAGQLLNPPRQTLGAYLTEWIESRGDIRPTTAESYRLTLGRLPDWLQRRPLDALTAEDLEQAYREVSARLAPATVRLLHRIVHAALARAVRRGHLARNVAALVELPRIPSKDTTTVTPEQVVRLLQAARGDWYEALYWLGIATGMRQGELLGLTWPNVDLDDGVITVCATLVLLRGEYRLGETKTGKVRQVDVPPVVLEALRSHRLKLCEARLRAGGEWNSWDLVFPNRAGKPTNRMVFNRSSWRPIRERAGLGGMDFKNATRHAAASLLLAGGISARDTATVLGHAQPTLTLNTYAHSLPAGLAAATALMEELLRKAAP